MRGCFGIDLARMHIEDHRAAFAERPAAHGADHRIGKQPQIASAEKAHGLAEHAHRGNRKFLDRARARLGGVGRECAGRKAAGLVRRRENRRVVAVARFHELVEKPRRALGDGKSRRAEAAHRLSAHILQQFARRARVLVKLHGRHLVDQAVEIAVRGDLMAGGDRFANELRKALGEIADDKAGGGGVAFRQELQQAVKVPLQPALQTDPIRTAAAPRRCPTG